MTTQQTILGIVAACLVLIVAAPAIGNDNVEFYGPRAAPYSTGVKVLPGRPLYFTSGGNSNVKDGATMKEQALATMKRLEANIAAAGYGIDDLRRRRRHWLVGGVSLRAAAGQHQGGHQ